MAGYSRFFGDGGSLGYLPIPAGTPPGQQVMLRGDGAGGGWASVCPNTYGWAIAQDGACTAPPRSVGANTFWDPYQPYDTVHITGDQLNQYWNHAPADLSIFRAPPPGPIPGTVSLSATPPPTAPPAAPGVPNLTQGSGTPSLAPVQQAPSGPTSAQLPPATLTTGSGGLIAPPPAPSPTYLPPIVPDTTSIQTANLPTNVDFSSSGQPSAPSSVDLSAGMQASSSGGGFDYSGIPRQLDLSQAEQKAQQQQAGFAYGQDPLAYGQPLGGQVYGQSAYDAQNAAAGLFGSQPAQAPAPAAGQIISGVSNQTLAIGAGLALLWMMKG